MYNKLFTKILDSSVWLEDLPTRIVWLTLIAAMDQDGFAQFAAVGNLANRARVSVKEAKAAIAKLEGPDAESSNQDYDGRRIERVPGGWMVLNAKAHQEMVTAAIRREQTRERVRKHRSRKAGNASVTQANDLVAPSDTDTDPKAETRSKLSRASRVAEEPADFTTFWAQYPKKRGRKDALKAWLKSPPDLRRVLAALGWQMNQPQWKRDGGRFVPNPATWLNRG